MSLSRIRFLAFLAPIALLAGCAPGVVVEGEIDESTAVGERSSWVVEILNDESDTTGSQWESVLDESFLEQMSADELAELINEDLRPEGPFEIVRFEAAGPDAVTTLQSAEEEISLSISTTDNGDIEGIFFSPAR